MHPTNPVVDRSGKRGRRARFALLGLGAIAFSTGGASAADASAGKAVARACAVCHGAIGVSVAPDAPNLAGQPAMYLSTQLRAFRSGERRHEVMSVIAKPLTDNDIDNLAAWFSSVRIEAHAPQ
jgi:cytochrome c553